MKKLALTIAVVLGLGMTTFADPNGGGLFQRGAAVETNDVVGGGLRSEYPCLPDHNLTSNQDADDAPLGSGVVALLGLGAAYLVGKKRREE